MKKFLLKTAILLSVYILLYCTAFQIAKYQFRTKLKQYPVIIMGDSRTEYFEFPNVFNYSFRGCPYFVQYEFVKEFSRELQGKTVYVSYNYINFSTLFQNRMANASIDPDWVATNLQRLDHFSLINYPHSEIRPAFLPYKPFDFKVEKRWENFCFSTYQARAYWSEDVTNDSIINLRINKLFFNSQYVLKDTIQKKYLNKIIDLLQANNTKVILLKMPDIDLFLEGVPQTVKDELQQIAIQQNVKLLDLNDSLKISHERKYFSDHVHLNKWGVKKVQNYIDSLGIMKK